ncbi:MAG: cation:proton antiporter, partial [Thaumarchaeota archaeon]|nr:cation:proton antiporter [Nitrososphaerota archaeon]
NAMVSESLVLSGVLTVSILVFLAKLLAGIFARVGIPSILGELSAGIIIGPSALGQFLVIFGNPLIQLNDIVLAFSEIGAILILFSAGLEMTFAEFRGVGAKSFIVGGLGVAIPFFSGFYVVILLGLDFTVALIVGAALSATSIAVTSKVLENLGRIGTQEAKLMINAAVVDDVLGLAVLAVVISVIQDGRMPSLVDIITKLSTIVVLWLAMLLALVFLIPPFLRLIPSWRVEGTEEAASTVICFGSASLAAILGLSPIVGAYAAGMGLAGSRSLTTVKKYIEKINIIFAPVFFAVIGASLNIAQITPESLLLLLLLVAVAIVSKLVGCGLPAGLLSRSKGSGLRVGVGMISRGEVGLVIAGLALSSQSINQDEYAALVGVVILTTIISPIVLKYLYKAKKPKEVEANAK